MRKVFWFIVIAVVAYCGYQWLSDKPAGAQDYPSITTTDHGPPVYKEAPDEINKKAEEKLARCFSNETSPEQLRQIFGDVLVCGPFLWDKIRSRPQVASITTAETIFHIPQLDKDGKPNGEVVAKGKLFQSADEIAHFWEAFSQRYDLAAEREIRKLNPRELQAYWAMIPFDITEPVFILESKDWSILTQFETGQMTIMWIDDYTSLRDPGMSHT
jgi:hypothetical protein